MFVWQISRLRCAPLEMTEVEIAALGMDTNKHGEIFNHGLTQIYADLLATKTQRHGERLNH